MNIGSQSVILFLTEIVSFGRGHHRRSRADIRAKMVWVTHTSPGNQTPPCKRIATATTDIMGMTAGMISNLDRLNRL